MIESLHTSAQLTLHGHAAGAALTTLRRELLQEPGFGSLSIGDLIAAAVVRTLEGHPRLNSTVEDGEIREWGHVNLGIAIAMNDGVVAPVVHNAGVMTLGGLMREIDRLEAKARDRRLTRDDFAGGTFTLSNLGRYRIDLFTPILDPPQAAILGVGRVAEKVGLSLTIDHRAIDGAPGAAFLTDLAELLEHPVSLV